MAFAVGCVCVRGGVGRGPCWGRAGGGERKGWFGAGRVKERHGQGPGQGEKKFAPRFCALLKHGYAGDSAVEPFDYVPDGPGAAARAVGYLKGILEGLATK